MKPDPRVDALIAKAGAFAQPLLIEMRKRIFKALPNATETIKWRMPFYEVNGKIVANMAAFKAHTKFGIWQSMQPVFVDGVTSDRHCSAAERAAFSKNTTASATRFASSPAPGGGHSGCRASTVLLGIRGKF